MKDFLTMKDSALAGFARGFVNGFGQIASLLNISNDAAAQISTVVDEYEETLLEIRETRVRLQALTVKKNTLRGRLKQSIRPLAKRILADDNVSKAQIANVGLKPRDSVRTRTPAPQTEPFITVGIARNRVHHIEIFDQGDALKRAKPEGITGAEIWVYIGDDAQFDDKNLRYLGTATRGKFDITHDAEDAGKTAHYLARWLNRRGEHGTWSNRTSATIAH